MNKWTYLATAIVLEVFATLSLRAMEGTERPWWAAGAVLGYAGAFAVVAQVLKAGMPVGLAYGVWAASGVALTALGGALLFGDKLTVVVGLGLVLIAAGVVTIELGSRREDPPPVEAA